MKSNCGIGACVVGLVIAGSAQTQSPDITSFNGNGMLTWTNSNTNLFYRIEWASALTSSNAWHLDYSSLNDIRSSDSIVTSSVPMFYRVCGSSNQMVYPAPVPKTWQISEYQAGDNGTYQTGIGWTGTRFKVGMGISSNCVTDTLTGLMWLRNPDSTSRTWSSAITYCDGLDGSTGRGGFVDWRLPNIRELQSLIDYGRKLPALPSNHPFENVVSSWYWSSTTYLDAPQYAWCVHFSNGYVFNAEPGKTGKLFVWPVRGGL